MADPLNPLSLLATRFPALAALTSGDAAWRSALRAITPEIKPFEVMDMQAFIQRLHPIGKMAALSMPSDPGYLRYRTLECPIGEGYRAAIAQDNAIILRDLVWSGHKALIGAQAIFADRRGFGTCLDMLRGIASTENCAFAALWAPARKPFYGALMRRGVLPIQSKQILFEKDCAPDLIACLPSLTLNMLDSDKI